MDCLLSIGITIECVPPRIPADSFELVHRANRSLAELLGTSPRDTLALLLAAGVVAIVIQNRLLCTWMRGS